MRESGFIPRDDDVDICMPYEDCCEFVDTFSVPGFKVFAPQLGNSYDTFAHVADCSLTQCTPAPFFCRKTRRMG
ncbi:MAG: LicD family protein [Bacteroidales bacterium]|nr:LicD family protein [Bacteroidales bacterium]